MTARNQGGLVVLSVKASVELADEIKQLAIDTDQTVSLTLTNLLQQALEEGGAKRLKRDLKDEGYQAGLRRGLHEVREHMKKLWSDE